MNEGHITREPVNKGFQTQVKREKKGVLWGGVVLKTLYDNFRVSKIADPDIKQKYFSYNFFSIYQGRQGQFHFPPAFLFVLLFV